MSDLIKHVADEYLPFDTYRKYIIIDKKNEHYGEVIRLYNDEEYALFYDFEERYYSFDPISFLGIHSRTQLARFSAVSKEMIYNTIAVANTTFMNEELVKLTCNPYESELFGFPKQMVEDMNKRTYWYEYLNNPESSGSTTDFLDFDIVKLGQTTKEIEDYIKKFDDHILFLRDKIKTEEPKEEDKDEKIKKLEEELAKAKSELKELKGE